MAEGHMVYGGDIQHQKNEYLNTIGGHSLKMDVTKDGEVQAGVDEIIKKHGHIDVLINNAGYGLYGPVEEVSIEDAMQQFNVNLFWLCSFGKSSIATYAGEKIWSDHQYIFHGWKDLYRSWSMVPRYETCC